MGFPLIGGTFLVIHIIKILVFWSNGVYLTQGNCQLYIGREAVGLMPYLEGQGDLVSGLIMGITRVTIWVIGVINLLTKSP